MEITIDIDNPLPQFEQLIEQIKAAVTAGVLKPGDGLPSIRQLANDLDLNSKTVAKAYQEWTLRKLGASIDELREAGVTDSEIRNAFAGAINRQPPTK